MSRVKVHGNESLEWNPLVRDSGAGVGMRLGNF